MTYITGTFKSQDGLTLIGRSWMTDRPKARIILCHGYLEHSARYDREASYFNNHGYDVYTYDQRGHGLSEGEKSYIHDFELLVEDFDMFVSKSTEDTDLPIFLFGHSMGGLVSLSYLLTTNSKIQNLKGVICSAPFIKASKDLAPLLQKISGFLGKYFPKLKTVGPDPKEISRDPKTVRKYVNDPLVYHDKVHARSGSQLLKQMKRLEPLYKNFTYPILIMHGTDDKLAEIEGSRQFYQKCQSADKKFIPLKEFKHEITREIGKDKVMQTIANWMDDRI